MKFSRLILLTLALWPACARSPVAPSPTAPAAKTIGGTWNGSYVAVCPGASNCASVGQAPSGAQPLSLALSQQGDALTGQISLSGWLPRVATVTGTIAPDGSMTIRGGDSWPRTGFCVPAGGWNILSWNARYDAQTDLISGDFSFTTQKHLSSCYYMADLMVNAANLVLRHGATVDPSFAGHWQGKYTIVKCTPVGWQSCIQPVPDYDAPFDLRLSQTGSTVTGELTNIPYGNSTPLPVSGSAAGAPALQLSGARPQDIGLGVETFRLTAWNVTRDDVGRLSGTMSYIDEAKWTSGPNAGSTFSTTYDAELKYVVRVPW